eukprot:CFRG4409T1
MTLPRLSLRNVHKYHLQRAVTSASRIVRRKYAAAPSAPKAGGSYVPAFIGFVGGATAVGYGFGVYRAQDDRQFRARFEKLVPGGQWLLEQTLGPKPVTQKPDPSWKRIPVSDVTKTPVTLDTTKRSPEVKMHEIEEAVVEDVKELVGNVQDGIHSLITSVREGMEGKGDVLVNIATKAEEAMGALPFAKSDDNENGNGSALADTKAVVTEAESKSGTVIENATDAVEDAKSMVSAVVPEASKEVLDLLEDVAVDGVNAMASLSGEVRDGLEQAVSDLKVKVESASEKASSASKNVSETVQQVGESVSEKVSSASKSVSETVQQVEDSASTIVNDVEETISKTGDDVKEEANNLVANVESFALDVKEKTKDAFATGESVVKDAVGQLQDAAEHIKDVSAEFVEKEKRNVNSIAENLASVSDDVQGGEEVVCEQTKGVRDGVQESVDSLGEKVEDVSENMSEALTEGTSAEIDHAISSLEERIRTSVEAADHLAESVSEQVGEHVAKAKDAGIDAVESVMGTSSGNNSTGASERTSELAEISSENVGENLETFFQKRVSDRMGQIDENIQDDSLLAARTKTLFLADELQRLVQMVSQETQESDLKIIEADVRAKKAVIETQKKIDNLIDEHKDTLVSLALQHEERIAELKAEVERERLAGEAAVEAEAALHDKLVEEEKHIWHSKNNEEQLETIKRLEELYEHYYQGKLKDQAQAQFEVGKQALLKRLSRERSERLATMEAMTLRLKSLDELLTKSKDTSATAHRLHSMWVGRSAVQDALDTSTPLPVSREELSKAGVLSSTSEVEDTSCMSLYQMAVDSLPPSLFTSGVPNYGHLQSRFADVRDAVRKTALMPSGENGSVGGGLGAYIAACVTDALTFRRSPRAPIMVAEGSVVEEPDAVLARVEFWLAQGDLRQAIDATSGLSGQARTAASSWIADAEALLAVQSALRLIDAYATKEAMSV